VSNQVYANDMEVACKAADGKSICAFPDVCFTPPQTPATPPGVPLPYPNTGFASDCSDGSSSVKISGQEVMLKNKSYFKKSTGDEAGCAPKKGAVNSKIMGKVYFIAWSMDVMIESENVVRHLDMTTHNHGSNANEPAPFPYLDLMAFGNPEACKEDTKRAQESCKGSTKTKVGERFHHTDCSEECKSAMQCTLVPKGKDKEMCCSPNNTGDHLVEDHWVRPKGVVMPDFAHIADKPGGAYNGAPTLCVNRSRFHDEHGVLHGTRGVWEDTLQGKQFAYSEGKAKSLQAQKDAYPKSNCSKGCIEAQLDAFYGEDPSKKCNSSNHKQALKEEQREAATKRTRSVERD
jgi:hypothetical protein